MKKEIRIREEFRRDGLAANYLVNAEMMKLIADAIPNSLICIGYPSTCAAEKQRCKDILEALKDKDVEPVLYSHAKIETLSEAGELIKKYKNASVTFWVPSSKTFLERTMKITQDEVIPYCEKLIREFKGKFNSNIDVAVTDTTNAKEVSPEFLANFSKKLHRAGARNVVICDTLGIGNPKQLDKVFSTIKKNDSQTIEFHPHNDNKMGIRNIDAAFKNGVNIINTAFFGSSERKSMIDPRILLKKGYNFPFNEKKFEAFLKIYKRKVGNPEKVLDKVYNKNTIVTGSQLRLQGRPNKKLLFGVTSDRFIIKKLMPKLKDKDDKYVRKKMNEIKDSLYKSKKIAYSKEDLTSF